MCTKPVQLYEFIEFHKFTINSHLCRVETLQKIVICCWFEKANLIHVAVAPNRYWKLSAINVLDIIQSIQPVTIWIEPDNACLSLELCIDQISVEMLKKIVKKQKYCRQLELTIIKKNNQKRLVDREVDRKIDRQIDKEMDILIDK